MPVATSSLIRSLRRLRTTAGRAQLSEQLYVGAWPLAGALAGAYRRTALSSTRLVAVVGSFGKSTTTQAVRAALGLPLKQPFGSNGSTGIAVRALLTRPGVRRVVLEVGINGPGQMARHAQTLRPDVVVVTSIGSEHRTSLGRLEVTRDEKAAMVRALLPGGLAVLNGDDQHVRWMASQTGARVVTCGLGSDNQIQARDISLDWPRGRRFTLCLGNQRREVRTRLLGREQLFSVLAAVAVGLEEGLGLDDVLARLAEPPPMPGRLAPVALPNGAYLLCDDFKSSLETIDAALDLLAEIPGRRQVVLGGITEPPRPQAPAYRRIGGRLAGLAERTIIVGDRFVDYAAGAHSAGLPRERILNAGSDVLRAAELVGQDLRSGDVVLIKGRGRQRLERVALALQGQLVRCSISTCPFSAKTRCTRCRMLERGWGEACATD